MLIWEYLKGWEVCFYLWPGLAISSLQMWGNCVQWRWNLLNLPAEGTGKLAIWAALQSDLWQTAEQIEPQGCLLHPDTWWGAETSSPTCSQSKAPPTHTSTWVSVFLWYCKRTKQKYPTAHERDTKRTMMVNFDPPGKRVLSRFQVWDQPKVTWC